MRIHHRRPDCADLDDRRVARSIIAREVDARQCILASLAKRIPPIVIIRVVSLQLLQLSSKSMQKKSYEATPNLQKRAHRSNKNEVSSRSRGGRVSKPTHHQQRHLPDRGIPRRVHGRTPTQRPHEEVSNVIETTFREALKGLVAEEL